MDATKVEHCMVFAHQNAPVLQASVCLFDEFFSCEQPFHLVIVFSREIDNYFWPKVIC